MFPVSKPARIISNAPRPADTRSSGNKACSVVMAKSLAWLKITRDDANALRTIPRPIADWITLLSTLSFDIAVRIAARPTAVRNIANMLL